MAALLSAGTPRIVIRSFHLGIIDIPVNFAARKQLVVRAEGGHAAVVQHEDAVCVLHGADALGDDEFRGVGDLLCESPADQGIRPGIYGAGGIVQDQYLGLFQQRARDAQALFLPAGHVGAALLDVSVIAVRQRADELVRLC